MKAKFRIIMESTRRKVEIRTKRQPVGISQVADELRGLLLAWGFQESSVNELLSPDDAMADMAEEIKALKQELKDRDGSVFNLVKNKFKGGSDDDIG